MKKLDSELYVYSEMLKSEIGIENQHLDKICTTIYNELNNLSKIQISQIETFSPVDLYKRIEELKAFNMMMERVNKELYIYPEIVRAQVIVQNYISFVYFKDNCFEETKKVIPSGTLLRRICKYLLNNPIRAFRNSIAHGNWNYKADYSGIIYFAKKDGTIENEELTMFEVNNEELNFWQALSRATAYTIYTYIIENKSEIM